MLKAREYAELVGAASGKDAALKRATDARNIVSKTRSRYLTYLLYTVREIQFVAKERSNRQDGARVEGMFELVAADTAKQFPIGSAAIKLIGFVGELFGDAVQATIDMWTTGLLEEETMNSTEFSGVQISFLERAKLLRTAANWCLRLKGVGILNTTQADRASEYTNTNSAITTLSSILKNEDIPAEEFKQRLLAKAFALDFSNADSKILLAHYEPQFSMYSKTLGAENRRAKALSKSAARIKADPELVRRILNGEEVFATKEGEASTAFEPVPDQAHAAGAGAETTGNEGTTVVAESTEVAPEPATPTA